LLFEHLSGRLGAVVQRLRGRTLSESDVRDVLREIRMALIDADVALPVAKAFTTRVADKAIGADVTQSLSAGQTIVKIVYDELVELLGGAQSRLQFAPAPPTVIVLVGLQGSGKTTQAGKLALHLKEQGRRSLLVAADVARPAAIAQLQTIGKQIDVPVFERGTGDPVAIARDGVAEARRLAIPTVIVDTAGRLQIDEALMNELQRSIAAVRPTETLFVADAMTGQEAARVAKGFHDRLTLTGIILTKMDGDTRGGAALSIFSETQVPIKFVGVGERLSALEAFYPDRLASRILGMGDVLTLIEKTQRAYDAEQAGKIEEKLLKQQFTLEDFLEQMRGMRKIGSMTDILKMLPGVSAKLPKDFEIPERELSKIEAIICSMTRRERARPEMLNGSRRKRIALGSGTQVSDVNRLVKQFEQARQMMKQFGGKRRHPMRLPAGLLRP
jgi:signal recognition particle subunit SRP54